MGNSVDAGNDNQNQFTKFIIVILGEHMVTDIMNQYNQYFVSALIFG